MKKVNLKVRNRFFSLCKNIYLRTRIRKFRNCICCNCHKFKRLKGSALFFSDRCRTAWRPKNHRWHVDSNDYAWICKQCLSNDSLPSLHIPSDKWFEAQSFSYKYSLSFTREEHLLRIRTMKHTSHEQKGHISCAKTRTINESEGIK